MASTALTPACSLSRGDRVRHCGVTHDVLGALATGDYVELRLAADAMAGPNGRLQRLLVRQDQLFKVVLSAREVGAAEEGAIEGGSSGQFIDDESYQCSVVGVTVYQRVDAITGQIVQCSGSAVCGVTRERRQESCGCCVWGGESGCE